MRPCLLLCCVACLILAACSQTATPPAPTEPARTAATPAPSAAPAKIPDLEFEPLTQQQVDLYLATMKAAVEKRRAISDPADLKALAFDAQIGRDLKAHPNRPMRKYTDEEAAMFQRADRLHYLDDEVAKARGDLELYKVIRNAIEGMIGPHKCTDSDCGMGIPEDDPKLRQEQLAEDKRRKAIVQQNLELLKAQEKQILELIHQVRE